MPTVAFKGKTRSPTKKKIQGRSTNMREDVPKRPFNDRGGKEKGSLIYKRTGLSVEHAAIQENKQEPKTKNKKESPQQSMTRNTRKKGTQNRERLWDETVNITARKPWGSNTNERIKKKCSAGQKTKHWKSGAPIATDQQNAKKNRDGRGRSRGRGGSAGDKQTMDQTVLVVVTKNARNRALQFLERYGIRQSPLIEKGNLPGLTDVFLGTEKAP